MTSLLDMLKEADLRIRFTDVFRSVTPRESLDRDLLHERLLLASPRGVNQCNFIHRHV